jgi:hypothetical protein
LSRKKFKKIKWGISQNSGWTNTQKFLFFVGTAGVSCCLNIQLAGGDGNKMKETALPPSDSLFIHGKRHPPWVPF